MKFMQHSSSRSATYLKSRMVAVALCSGALFLGGCALNPFASKPAAPEQSAAPTEAGIVQTSQSKKLFGVLPVYRANVQQGNFVSKEMVSQLKVGMTPEQVRFVMGTPLGLPFPHASGRWPNHHQPCIRILQRRPG